MGIRMDMYAIDRKRFDDFISNTSLADLFILRIKNNDYTKGLLYDVSDNITYAAQSNKLILNERNNNNKPVILENNYLLDNEDFKISVQDYLKNSNVYRLKGLCSFLDFSKEHKFIRLVTSNHRIGWMRQFLITLEKSGVQDSDRIKKIFKRILRNYLTVIDENNNEIEYSFDDFKFSALPLEDDLDERMGYVPEDETNFLVNSFQNINLEKIRFRKNEEYPHTFNEDEWEIWVKEIITDIKNISNFNFDNPELVTFVG